MGDVRKPDEVISDFFEVTERRAGNCVKALDAAGYVIVPKEPTGAQRQLFTEMVKAGDNFSKIYPAVLNEWVP